MQPSSRVTESLTCPNCGHILSIVANNPPLGTFPGSIPPHIARSSESMPVEPSDTSEQGPPGKYIWVSIIAALVILSGILALVWNEKGNDVAVARPSLSQPQPRPARINDAATQMCETYQGVVRQAITMRLQGVPMSHAESMAEAALRVDRRLWSALIASIRSAYSSPDAMRDALQSGRWLAACSSQVRGY